MTEPSAVVICMPVVGSDPACVVPFSGQSTCSQCQQRIWVSKSALALKAAEYVCMTCFMKEEPEPDRAVHRLPGSSQELVDSMGEAGQLLLHELDAMGITELEPE